MKEYVNEYGIAIEEKLKEGFHSKLCLKLEKLFCFECLSTNILCNNSNRYNMTQGGLTKNIKDNDPMGILFSGSYQIQIQCFRDINYPTMIFIPSPDVYSMTFTISKVGDLDLERYALHTFFPIIIVFGLGLFTLLCLLYIIKRIAGWI